MKHRTLSAIAGLLVATGCTPNNVGFLEATPADLSRDPAAREGANDDLIEACGDVEVHEAGKALSRRPYLQRTTTNGTRILWAGAGLEGSSVLVTTPDGLLTSSARAEREERISGETSPRFHAALGGLKRATTYCYELRDVFGKPLIGRIGFRTAPAAGSPASFIVIGDSGDGTDDQRELAEQLGTVPFDFMLHVGDIAYSNGTFLEFDANFFAYYDELIMHHAIFPVPGNHEYRSRDARPFRALFDLPNNERWYSFDWGDVHFLALDTQRLGGEQLDFARSDLSKNEKPYTVVLMHKPAYSSGWHGSHDSVRSTVSPLFERFGVDLVLQGHDHHYERTKPQNGVHYIVTGGGGGGTYPVRARSFTAVAQEVVHFVYVTADDTELVARAIDGTGAEFDQLVIPRD